MKDIVISLDSVIMTIPGIGPINGVMILGEIGDINRFPKPRKLLAFAGLDPSVYQSGNFIAKKTKMSKRGSSALRYALMNAAHNIVKYNQTFKEYYDIAGKYFVKSKLSSRASNEKSISSLKRCRP